jgi:hypothetical protein
MLNDEKQTISVYPFFFLHFAVWSFSFCASNKNVQGIQSQGYRFSG